MTVSEKSYPSEKGEIKIIKIENESGAYVMLSSWGAGIVEVAVPDRHGKIENVALRYANPADYLYDGPCLGKVPGRYANRIADGKLVVEGKEYKLAINNGPNHLHGGIDGFSNKNWDAEIFENGVRFTYVSADGEENYPGTLKVTATYRWSEDNRLSLDLHAETDKETVVNLTNHAYWNLEGADAGTALNQEMRMKAHNWLPTDATQIPTGEVSPVAETPMDFTEWKEVGRDIKEDFEALKIGKGYDHCWVIDEWEPGKIIENAVELRDNKSGRLLSVSSDQPGVQIYTGNWLTGCPANCSGRGYEDYEGVAIEMQGFPDAPNKPGFPSQTLRPGESYDRSILFSFSTF